MSSESVPEATEPQVVTVPGGVNGVQLSFRDDNDDTIYTYEGWRHFVSHEPPEKPERLSTAEYQALSPEAREAYDELRRKYIMRFGALATPDLSRIHHQIWKQLMSNLYLRNDKVKVGAVIDGYAGLGKSTIAKTFARKFEKWVITKTTFATPAARNAFIPVVHVTLKGLTTARGLAESICKFLGITVRGRYTEQQLVDAICEAVRRHTVLLFVIDDIHFLDPRQKQNGNIGNHLKALMSLTGITFLYVGIDCEKLGIFRDQANNNMLASQTASRFTHQVVKPYTRADEGWRQLICSIEVHLVLLEHEQGSLERLDRILFSQTKGNIGSLMNLIQKAAFWAIGAEERVDRAVLKATQIDYKASREGQRDDGIPPDGQKPKGKDDESAQTSGPAAR